MDKIKDISLLFLAGGKGSPDAFAPAHAGLAASALRNFSVDHHGSNLPFGAVVGRLDRFGQEAKIIFGGIPFKPLGQCFGQLMVRWTAHVLEKFRFDSFHRPLKAFFGKRLPPMQRLKEFFEL